MKKTFENRGFAQVYGKDEEGALIEIVDSLHRIPRFCGANLIHPPTVGAHTLNVSIIFLRFARALNLEYLITAEVMEKVLMHDTIEGVTNDIPYPVKHFTEDFHKRWEDFETKLTLQEFPFLFPYTSKNLKSMHPDLYVIFKLADTLDAWLTLAREFQLGNKDRRIIQMMKSYAKYLLNSAFTFVVTIMRSLYPEALDYGEVI